MSSADAFVATSDLRAMSEVTPRMHSVGRYGWTTWTFFSILTASGITFRHQQNAALNASDDLNSLGSFYKYKNKFTPEQLRSFVPVPKECEWWSSCSRGLLELTDDHHSDIRRGA